MAGGTQVGFLTGQRFDFRFEGVSPAKGYALPTIEFSFLRSSRAKSREKPEANLVTNIGMTVSIKNATQYNLTIVGDAK